MDLPRDRQRLVGGLRGAARIGAPHAAAGRNHLRQPLAEIILLAPQIGMGSHHVINGVNHLRGRRE
jgi:hypothetical protein